MKKIIILVSIIIVAMMMSSCTLALIGSLVGDDESAKDAQTTTSSSTATPTPNQSKQSPYYVVGDTYKSSKEELTLVECGEYTSDNRFIQPREGYRYIYLKFEFVNLDKYDQIITSYDFNCYSDSVACDSRYFGDDTLSATISSGRKAVGKVYFEVPIDAKSIEVEYDENIWDDKKVVFLYKD